MEGAELDCLGEEKQISVPSPSRAQETKPKIICFPGSSCDPHLQPSCWSWPAMSQKYKWLPDREGNPGEGSLPNISSSRCSPAQVDSAEAEGSGDGGWSPLPQYPLIYGHRPLLPLVFQNLHHSCQVITFRAAKPKKNILKNIFQSSQNHRMSLEGTPGGQQVHPLLTQGHLEQVAWKQSWISENLIKVSGSKNGQRKGKGVRIMNANWTVRP